MLRVAVVLVLAYCLLVTSAVSVDVSDEVYSDYVEERVQDSLLQQQRTVNNSAQPRSNSALQKRHSVYKNVALNRPAWQSSFWDVRNPASLANDGKLDTHFDRGSCRMHTKLNTNPWWAVDLGSRLRVDSVKFTNRGDCCGHTSKDFIIGLTDVPPLLKAPRLRQYDVCGQWPGYVRNSATVTLKCAANLPPRRYVVVQIPRRTHLNFCELQVFATRADCPKGFTYKSSAGNCYAVVIENLSWLAAGLRCRSLHKDAHLLVIDNAEEQATVAGLVASTSAAQLAGCYKYSDAWGRYFWTAGQRIDPSSESEFIWRLTSTHICGETISEMRYTNWASSQPSYSGGNQACMHLCSGKHYAWNDLHCDDKACSVCELKMQ